MTWLVIASSCLVAYVSLTVACPQYQSTGSVVPTTGPCASIGYGDKCCPGHRHCLATNYLCQCGASCYADSSCCSDNPCIPKPKTCTDYGHESCCEKMAHVSPECPAYLYRNEDDKTGYDCSCNLRTCQPNSSNRSRCCEGALGCSESCGQANIELLCSWEHNSESCYVEGGECYCDCFCIYFGDCCSDARNYILGYFKGKNRTVMEPQGMRQPLIRSKLSDIQWNDSDEQLEFALAARLQKARSLRAQANQGKSN